MRAFFRIFKNRWVITAIGFIAVAILVWFVGPQIAIAGTVPLASPMARLVTVVLLALVWIISLLLKQVKLAKANTQFAQDVSSGSVAENDDEKQRSVEELVKLKERFEEALEILKKSGKGKRRINIYELPWYIIIGPPGSGKTTALVNSGLQFPLADALGEQKVKGVGGTRNCDWWFTDEAVLIDTAGRYTTQDSHAQSDRAAWEGFLQLLVRYRKRRPINGALVAISVQDLLIQNVAQREAQISAIKHRLEELNSQLKCNFPVYVLFTKCDLIPGFIEFFEDLGREDRGQVWGMTFPYTGTADPMVVSNFGSEFDSLVNRLNERVVTRMEQERDIGRRARIFSFPQQFDGLKPLMADFLTDLFKASRFHSDSMLRGVYFTSGTQEGTPIDRVMASMSRGLGVNPQAVIAQNVQGKSYFITRLLRDLIFTEADLAGTNRRLEVQRFWVQRAAYASAVILTGLAVLAWTTSYTRNQVYVNRADSALEDYKSVKVSHDVHDTDFVSILEPLNASRAVLDVYRPFQDDVPFLMGMGLYQGNRIDHAAQDAYARELQQSLLPAISKRLERHLEIGENNPDFQYQALKTYLMLGDTDHLDKEVVQNWMELDWGSTYSQRPEIQGQLQEHLSAMLTMGFDPIELSKSMVKSARTNLKLVPVADLLYGMVKRDYIASDNKPLLPVDLYGNSGSKVFEYVGNANSEPRISSLFTYEGYHDYYKKQLPAFVERAEREAWVLEDDPRSYTLPEKKRIHDDLLDLYLSDFINTWAQILANIRVASFDTLSQATSALNVASSTASPIRRILEVTARNTSLADRKLLESVGKLGEKVASKNRFGRLFESATDKPVTDQLKLPEEVVVERFEPISALTRANDAGVAPLDETLAMLSRLYGQVDAVTSGFGLDPLNLVKGGAQGEILMQMQVEAARQPEPLRSWLLQFVRNSRSVGYLSAREQINREWRATVYPECKAALNGRYPFSKEARREVTLADFGRLFRPNGLIDTFFTQYLKPFTEVRGGRRQWKNVDGIGIGISNEVLRQFQLASSIKGMFFQAGGNTPAISFRVKPVYLDANVDAVSLNLEGQNYGYRHGPQFLQNAIWPNPDSTGIVRLEFIDDSGNRLVQSYEGPWAWFRLLEDSEVKSKTGDIALVKFEHRGRQSTWELHAQSVENPFLMDQMRWFRCPETL